MENEQGPSNPLEGQIEDGFSALRAANKAYKSAIGDRQGATQETAAARARLNEVESAEAGSRQNEEAAKTGLIDAIDAQVGMLTRARGLLVPPGE